MNLQEKVAVVTGGGQGLGRAYAEALAGAGARVMVNDLDGDAAKDTVRAITDAGGEAVADTSAIGSAEAADGLVAHAVEAFGRLDAMVTNAGILRDSVLWKMTDQQFDQVVETHLRGTFTCARAAARCFREQGDGGRIICIGSPTGQQGNFGQTNYAAAKAGIVGMVRTWAMELARAGVTVNAVVPVAATAMTDTVPFLKPYVEQLVRGEDLAPFARRELGFGTPQDAAGAVVFLASDAASGITGQVIGIGGDRLVLWTHPVEAAVAFAEPGGWTADEIAAAWPTTFEPVLQPVGPQLPPAPA